MHIFNTSFDKVYVINMAKDVKRMTKMKQLMDKERCNFERIEAVNGKEVSKEDREKYVSRACGVLCTDSIIGCALSHYFIWKRVLEEGLDSVLVLEDDVFFVDDYKTIFANAMRQLPDDWDVFYLGCHGLCNKDKSYKNPFISVFHLVKNSQVDKFVSKNVFIPEFPLATHAYAISASGCKKLLEAMSKVAYHVDVMMAFQHKLLNVYACNPNIAYQLSEDSSISNKGFPKMFNTMLAKYKDEKNFTYDYFFCLPIMKYVNFWTLLFTIAGILGYYNKYIAFSVLALLMVELDVSNPYYVAAVFGFITSYVLMYVYRNRRN